LCSIGIVEKCRKFDSHTLVIPTLNKIKKKVLKAFIICNVVYFRHMSINIRNGVNEDLPAVVAMIKELANYEKAIEEVEITVEDLEKDGFGDHPYFWILIAEIDGEIAGLAFYFIRYSTWKGKLLYLEDFIVKEKYRRQGIGTLLFDELKRRVESERLAGLVWQVLDWNVSAIKFYEKQGAKISSEWLDGKL